VSSLVCVIVLPAEGNTPELNEGWANTEAVMHDNNKEEIFFILILE